MVTFEKQGVPSVGISNEHFQADWKMAAKTKGMPGARCVFSPLPSNCVDVEQCEAAAVEMIDRLINALTRPPTPEEMGMALEEHTVERIACTGTLQEVNQYFYEREMTDGLPIVPPTEAAVKEMLTGTDLPPDHVVTTILPELRKATVEKIAVNAVMAGCRPEYMPVLIAAVEAVTNPEFHLRTMATTTNPDVPMLIVGGAVSGQLDINSGTNALGRGWNANATLGRALHLVIQNIGGSWPGVTDMSCLGQPGDFAMCLAENAEANPWEPIHMELGFPRAANVVTVIGAEGAQNILGIGQKSEGYLKMVAEHLAGMGRAHRSVVLLIIAQDTAAMLSKEGWTKEKIKQFIKTNALMPFPKYKERFIDTGMARLLGGVPSWVFETKDPNAMIPVPFIDQFLVLVSGGPGEKSMLIPGWLGSKAVGREIRLPENWEDLLKKSRP